MSNCCKIVVRYFSCDEYLKCLGSRSRWVNISWQYISCILKEVYVVRIAVIVWLHRLQDGISWLSWCLHQQIIPWNWQDNSGYRTLQTECNIYSSSSGKMCVYRLNSIVSWDCLREVFIFWCFLIPLWPFHHFRQSFKECYTCKNDHKKPRRTNLLRHGFYDRGFVMVAFLLRLKGEYFSTVLLQGCWVSLRWAYSCR